MNLSWARRTTLNFTISHVTLSVLSYVNSILMTVFAGAYAILICRLVLCCFKAAWSCSFSDALLWKSRFTIIIVTMVIVVLETVSTRAHIYKLCIVYCTCPHLEIEKFAVWLLTFYTQQFVSVNKFLFPWIPCCFFFFLISSRLR